VDVEALDDDFYESDDDVQGCFGDVGEETGHYGLQEEIDLFAGGDGGLAGDEFGLVGSDDVEGVELDHDDGEDGETLFLVDVAEDPGDGFFAFGVGEEGYEWVEEGGFGHDGFKNFQIGPEALVECLESMAPFEEEVESCFIGFVCGLGRDAAVVVFYLHEGGVDSFYVL